jgi:hypothetical protein
MKCAVINTENLIVNIIMAEPIDLAPQGCFLVGVEEDVFCDIGWSWDGTSFVDPNPPAIQSDTPDG